MNFIKLLNMIKIVFFFILFLVISNIEIKINNIKISPPKLTIKSKNLENNKIITEEKYILNTNEGETIIIKHHSENLRINLNENNKKNPKKIFQEFDDFIDNIFLNLIVNSFDANQNNFINNDFNNNNNDNFNNKNLNDENEFDFKLDDEEINNKTEEKINETKIENKSKNEINYKKKKNNINLTKKQKIFSYVCKFVVYFLILFSFYTIFKLIFNLFDKIDNINGNEKINDENVNIDIIKENNKIQ